MTASWEQVEDEAIWSGWGPIGVVRGRVGGLEGNAFVTRWRIPVGTQLVFAAGPNNALRWPHPSTVIMSEDGVGGVLVEVDRLPAGVCQGDWVWQHGDRREGPL